MFIFNSKNTEQSKQLFKELSNLLKAGISLHNAIDILIKEAPFSLKNALIQLRENLHKGSPFQHSLPLFLPSGFPAHFASITTIPQLDDFLSHLEKYLEKKLETAQHVIKQLTYPTILILSLMILSVAFMLIIAPTYLQFFESTGLAPPYAFVLFQKMPIVLKTYGIWIVLIVALPFSHPGIRKIGTHKAQTFFKTSNHGEILWILGILIENGIPLIKSLQCINLPPSSHHFQTMQKMIHHTEQSGSLSEGIKASRFVSEKHTALITNAERSRRLGQTLINIGKEIIESEQKRLERLTSTIQPILLALIGLLITGFTYISFVPILKSLQQL